MLRTVAQRSLRQVKPRGRTYYTDVLRIEETGEKATIDHRFNFEDEAYIPRSPWHDIPLRVARNDTFNAVIEIPSGTAIKYEAQTTEDHTPIGPDRTKEGHMRSYAYDSLVNYGFFPQTWENPNEKDAVSGLQGDNDPLDICDLSEIKASHASMYQVKVLGSFGLIDEGEIDWKILCVRSTDPMAGELNDITSDNVPSLIKRKVDDVCHWFEVYKIPEGKPMNKLLQDGRLFGKTDTLEIIKNCHNEWKQLIEERQAQAKQDEERGVYGYEAVRFATKQLWVPAPGWQPPQGTGME